MADLLLELGRVDQDHINRGLYNSSVRFSSRRAANEACLRRILEARVGSVVRSYEDAQRFLDRSAVRYLSSELNRITSAWRQRLLRECSEEARKSSLAGEGERRRAIERGVAAEHARAFELVQTEKARHDLRPRSVPTDVLGRGNVLTAPPPNVDVAVVADVGGIGPADPSPPAAPTPDSPAAAPAQGMMSSRELAQRSGLHHERLRKRLERWRGANLEGWISAENRKRGEPRYLYSAVAVAPILDEMRASAIASADRPSTKK